MMRINEFIKKVNEHDEMQANKADDGIMVGIPPKLSQSSYGLNAYCIPEDATNFIEIESWSTSTSLYWKKPDREYLSALIEEFLHTPIKERFPEKKYRLRWIDDDDGNANYLDYFGGKWSYGLTESARQYSQHELDKLKRENPRLAPAIDILKEPVEDD